MMVETKTRTQRRMERKQALILLVLVLAVSLSSFTLGVIVGRRGAERDMAQRFAEPRRIMVAEAPIPQAGSEVTAPAESESAEEEKLTFYDNLSRGETVPLGSGINLPPKVEQPAIEKPQAEKPQVADTQKQNVEKTSEKVSEVPAQKEPAVKESSEIIPPAVASGTFSVQVGSFSSVADAGRLKKKLTARGYPVFIAEADLGPKGLWYRVRLGPYADSEQAQRAMRIADKKDKIKGFISRL